MGLRGSSLAQSRGGWAMQEDLLPPGGLRAPGENVKARQRRQAAVPWTCLLDIWLNCTMKVFNLHEWSMSQTTGIKSLMCSVEISRGGGVSFIWKPPFGIYYVLDIPNVTFSSVTKKMQLWLIWYCLKAGSVWSSEKGAECQIQTLSHGFHHFLKG